MPIQKTLSTLFIATLASSCLAQVGQTTAHASATFFNGDEGSTYYSLTADHKLTPTSSLSLRYTGSPRTTKSYGGFGLERGGNDFEGMYFFDSPLGDLWKVGLGAALPDVPDRSRSLVGTFDASTKAKLGDKAEGVARIKGIIANDPLIFAEAEAGYRPTMETYAFVRFGVPVTGNNTRSTVSGDAIRQGVGSLGFRYMREPGMSLELALTNQLGETTGLSMTPALGRSMGVSVKFGMRF